MRDDEIIAAFSFWEPEELDPELAEYMVTNSEGWPMIKHPLVFSIFHTDALNRYVNKQLRQKTTAIAEAHLNHEWGSYVWLHERPYRVGAFVAIAPELNDEEYWSLLGRIWRDSENIQENPTVWERLLNAERSHRELIMTEEDRAEFAGLSPFLRVYQGHTDKRNDGYSWTLNRKIAEWFGRRFAQLEGGKPMMTIGHVRKRDVIALFLERNEEEIIARRADVTITSVHPL